ncbi:hypothetical protein HOLleu_25056 [Holothuria leucospilota]|uniref:Uncharacterized protein n=1 Tax=Holothuria leucospilota TaxID=206669 RepID=A0A9Q1H3Q2_HOLLE|nr:hypothetical protein HOLleu_25056 [Holothuria leucospilota]
MASLPADRVTPNKPPFAHTGVDCFGSFYGKRGRWQERGMAVCSPVSPQEQYTLKCSTLWTHIFSRRATQEKIRSNNGTNFVRGSKELQESIRK